jgi:hypothetical protein
VLGGVLAALVYDRFLSRAQEPSQAEEQVAGRG